MMNEPRARTTHELKTWPEFFEQTRNGRKKFEFRRNDRDFRVGDELLLKEWNPAPKFPIYNDGEPIAYTGRDLLVRVDYIMGAADVAGFGYRGISPVDRGYVIMSISLVH